MHASTAVLIEWLGGIYFLKAERLETYLVLCPRLTSASFAVVAKKHAPTIPTYQLCYAKHLFARFGNSSTSHTQMTSHLGPGVFTPKSDRGGGVYCVAGEFFVFLF